MNIPLRNRSHFRTDDDRISESPKSAPLEDGNKDYGKKTRAIIAIRRLFRERNRLFRLIVIFALLYVCVLSTTTEATDDTVAEIESIGDSRRTDDAFQKNVTDNNTIRIVPKPRIVCVDKFSPRIGAVKIEARRGSKSMSGSYYSYGKAIPFETESCAAMADWQKRIISTCNNLHELGVGEWQAGTSFINSGYYRDVWKMRDSNGDFIALKTLRFGHYFTENNANRHNHEAMAMAMTTSSDRILDIYGNCGNSGLFEFAPGRDLEYNVKRYSKEMKPAEALDIAIDVAVAISDSHLFRGKYATVAHTDIKPQQFVLVNGRFKLGDFNRCRFLAWSEETKAQCKFHSSDRHKGRFRSPEEYKYEGKTEKIDVYTLGNLLYYILTSEYPFKTIGAKKVQKMIIDGKRPTLPEYITNTSHPAYAAISDAINKCHVHDPNERPGSNEIMNDLITARYNFTRTESALHH